MTDHFYNLRENEYIVKSDHLYKATSARNPYINLYLKINGNLMKDDADTLPDNPKSEVQLVFSKECRYGQEVKSPYAIASIYPKPNQITPDIIGYVGNEKVREVLENGGVYVAESGCPDKLSNSSLYTIKISKYKHRSFYTCSFPTGNRF